MTSASELHSQFYQAIVDGDLDKADQLEERINALIEAQKNGEAQPDEDDDVFDTSIPYWFWWLLAFGFVGVIALLTLLLWLVFFKSGLMHWISTH